MFICWNVCYWTGFFPVSIRVASQQLDPVLPSSFYFLLFFFSFYRVSCDVCDRNLFGSGLCTRIQCVTGFYLVEYWVFFLLFLLETDWATGDVIQLNSVVSCLSFQSTIFAIEDSISSAGARTSHPVPMCYLVFFKILFDFQEVEPVSCSLSLLSSGFAEVYRGFCVVLWARFSKWNRQLFTRQFYGNSVKTR